MKRFNALLIALFMASFVMVPTVILSGCPAIGVQAPHTFNERVVAGYKTVEWGADTVGLLLDAGKLSAADARNSKDSLQTFKDGLDVAVQIQSGGDFATAEGRLQASLAGLMALEAYLRSRQ